MKPQDRIPRINALPELLRKAKAKEVLDCFRIAVDPHLISVKANTLPAPWLSMPGSQDFQPTKSWGPECGRNLKFPATKSGGTVPLLLD